MGQKGGLVHVSRMPSGSLPPSSSDSTRKSLLVLHFLSCLSKGASTEEDSDIFALSALIGRKYSQDSLHQRHVCLSEEELKAGPTYSFFFSFWLQPGKPSLCPHKIVCEMVDSQRFPPFKLGYLKSWFHLT